MYVTPERYRTMGFGVDLNEIDDVDLRSILQSASAAVDAYCNVPLLPQKHDFRGGTITGEIHRWRLGNDVGSELGQRRFHAFHKPLRSVSSFRIHVTNTQYVNIDPNDLFLNQAESWAEVISLAVTSIGVFSAGVLPNIGLNQPHAIMDYTYGWQFAITDDVLDPTDGFTFRAQNQWWVADSVTIYKNGVDVTDDVTLDLNEGTATFATQPLVSDLITADYTHKLPRDIAFATGIIATNFLNERELNASGMGRVEAMQVEEISIRRSLPQRSQLQLKVIPEEAALLLAGYVYTTVR